MNEQAILKKLEAVTKTLADQNKVLSLLKRDSINMNGKINFLWMLAGADLESEKIEAIYALARQNKLKPTVKPIIV